MSAHNNSGEKHVKHATNVSEVVTNYKCMVRNSKLNPISQSRSCARTLLKDKPMQSMAAEEKGVLANDRLCKFGVGTLSVIKLAFPSAVRLAV